MTWYIKNVTMLLLMMKKLKNMSRIYLEMIIKNVQKEINNIYKKL